MVDSFYVVLTNAVRDFSERGFVSEEQLAEWMAAIRLAAERDMVDPRTLESEMAASFRSIFENMVNKGGILRYHDGLPAWRLKQLAPRLHTELDRRIMANAQLIKLNRARAIETTLQRFSGWSTSIPAGGSKVVNRVSTKSEIRKSLARLPFEERRVLIDQGHKFVGDLNGIIARDGGAIAGEWHSHFRQVGYNARPDHVERDSKFYMIPGNWALEKGLVKAMDGQWADRITKPGEEIFCFPGDSKVPLAGPVAKGYRRWYDGEMAEVVTSTGKVLRATPNHPVLTTLGWKPAGTIQVGDQLVKISNEALSGLEENHDHRVASISEIFDALKLDGVSEELPLVATDFHGDGSDGQVETVSAHRPLLVDSMTEGDQELRYLAFAEAAYLLGDQAYRLGSFDKGFLGILHALSDGSSVFGERLALLRGDSTHTQGTSLGDASHLDAERLESGLKGWAANPDIPGDREKAFFLDHVSAEGVVDVKVGRFSGHVYNLQTGSGVYTVEELVVHNCRCSYRYVYNLRDLKPEMLTEKGKEELARVKALIKSRFSAT
jgi:hypothetical protein